MNRIKIVQFPAWARADLSASFVVFLLGLPLALGISLTVQAPMSAGLIAAAVGGLVPGLVGSVPVQISGPAVGVTLVSAHIGYAYGFSALCWVTVVAGALQLVLGRLHFARLTRRFPPAVLNGMLAGVGLSILATQAHIVLGTLPGSSVWRSLEALPAALQGQVGRPLAVAALTLGVARLWRQLPGHAVLPGALVGIAAATAAVAALGWEVATVRLPDDVWSQGPRGWPQLPWPFLLANAAGLALMASLYTVLGALALSARLPAGRPGRREMNLDREVMAVGAANIISGLLGGLPITGVLARSVAALEAGARSRLTNFLQGAWVLVCLGLGAAWFTAIPLASLAALFLAVGATLIRPRQGLHAYRQGMGLAYGVAALGVVAANLLVGAVAGLTVGAVERRLWLRRCQRRRAAAEDVSTPRAA